MALSCCQTTALLSHNAFEMVDGKESLSASDATAEESSIEAAAHTPKGRWERIQEVIWDGPRPTEEKRLVQRLDIFLL